MLTLTLVPAQRVLVAEAMRDLANVVAGALVFGQALSDAPFSLGMAAAGLALWCGLVAFAARVLRREPS
jgi:hypothetical protein